MPKFSILRDSGALSSGSEHKPSKSGRRIQSKVVPNLQPSNMIQTSPLGNVTGSADSLRERMVLVDIATHGNFIENDDYLAFDHILRNNSSWVSFKAAREKNPRSPMIENASIALSSWRPKITSSTNANQRKPSKSAIAPHKTDCATDISFSNNSALIWKVSIPGRTFESKSVPCLESSLKTHEKISNLLTVASTGNVRDATPISDLWKKSAENSHAIASSPVTADGSGLMKNLGMLDGVEIPLSQTSSWRKVDQKTSDRRARAKNSNIIGKEEDRKASMSDATPERSSAELGNKKVAESPANTRQRLIARRRERLADIDALDLKISSVRAATEYSTSQNDMTEGSSFAESEDGTPSPGQNPIWEGNENEEGMDDEWMKTSLGTFTMTWVPGENPRKNYATRAKLHRMKEFKDNGTLSDSGAQTSPKPAMTKRALLLRLVTLGKTCEPGTPKSVQLAYMVGCDGSVKSCTRHLLKILSTRFDARATVGFDGVMKASIPIMAHERVTKHHIKLKMRRMTHGTDIFLHRRFPDSWYIPNEEFEWLCFEIHIEMSKKYYLMTPSFK